MLQEYCGYKIDGRSDFGVQELDANTTMFYFDPMRFEITLKQAKEFKDSFNDKIKENTVIDSAHAPLGIMSLITDPTTAHYYESEMIKDEIIKFIFDHRIEEFDG